MPPPKNNNPFYPDLLQGIALGNKPLNVNPLNVIYLIPIFLQDHSPSVIKPPGYGDNITMLPHRVNVVSGYEYNPMIMAGMGPLHSILMTEPKPTAFKRITSIYLPEQSSVVHLPWWYIVPCFPGHPEGNYVSTTRYSSSPRNKMYIGFPSEMVVSLRVQGASEVVSDDRQNVW